MPPNRLRRDFIDELVASKESHFPDVKILSAFKSSTHDICLKTMWNERDMELEELDTVVNHFSPAGRELCHSSALTHARSHVL